GRVLKKELKKVVALYEKAQQDETIRNIVNNVNLDIKLKQTTYGLTKYYYISIVYESQKIHPLIFHKALLLTNQSASFFSTVLFSRFEDTSKYDKIKEFEITYDYSIITKREVYVLKPNEEEVIKQFLRNYVSYPPYSSVKRINYSNLLIKREEAIGCFHKFKVNMYLNNIIYKIKFPYVSGTINEETLEGDLELLPIMPPFWRKDNKPQLIFSNDYIVPQKISISLGGKDKIKEKQQEPQSQQSEQKSEQKEESQEKKKTNIIPILALIGFLVLIGGKLK
ncbi:MAG: hypothetical protein ABIL47_07955, partial [candidate division WOR-3 bacterium]